MVALRPNLTLALSKASQAPPLLAATASVALSELLPQSRTTYTYDANGNTTAEVAPTGTTTYTWDGENRLSAVSKDGVTEQHQYGATGLRRRKGETSYLWDGQNLLAELDSALSTLAQYTDFPGRWGGLSAMRRGGASRFHGFDMSANTRDLLDAAGTAERYLYSAFGPELLSPADANPYRFGGRYGYFGDGVGWLYVRARHLVGALGRWSSRDPRGRFGGPAYSYVRSKPLRYADPTGLREYGAYDESAFQPGYPDRPVDTEPLPWLPAAGMSDPAPAPAEPDCLDRWLDEMIDCYNYGSTTARRNANLTSQAFGDAHPEYANKAHRGWDDGIDAFRHCLWTCQITRHKGAQCAWLVGTGHELIDAPSHGQAPSPMDLHNNSVGRRIGAAGGDCDSGCQSALKDGRLRYSLGDVFADDPWIF